MSHEGPVGPRGARGASFGLTMSVKQVQALLVYLGYDPGPLDGVLTAKTREAVAEYQKTQCDLRVDGDPGPFTWTALVHSVWQPGNSYEIGLCRSP